jgi:hypothetical protein
MLSDQILTKTLESLKLYCKNPEKVNIEWIGSEKINLNQEVPAPPPVKMIPSNDANQKDIVEWLNPTVLFEPNFPGDLKITASGDISLIADKVDFDGFQILLTKRDTEFQPKVG